MEVNQTADDLLRFEALSTDLRLPVVAKRTAGATVSVQDGDTVVLGGLISDRTTHTKTGIPFFKDLPLIGSLFRSTDTQKEKVELLVFLTPHVVRNAEEARMLTAEEESLLKHLPKGVRICPPVEGSE
jgi:general secretion pathway protein D